MQRKSLCNFDKSKSRVHGIQEMTKAFFASLHAKFEITQENKLLECSHRGVKQHILLAALSCTPVPSVERQSFQGVAMPKFLLLILVVDLLDVFHSMCLKLCEVFVMVVRVVLIFVCLHLQQIPKVILDSQPMSACHSKVRACK